DRFAHDGETVDALGEHRVARRGHCQHFELDVLRRRHEGVQCLADGIDALQRIDRYVVIDGVGGKESEQLVDVLPLPRRAKVTDDSFRFCSHRILLTAPSRTAAGRSKAHWSSSRQTTALCYAGWVLGLRSWSPGASDPKGGRP